MAPDIETKYTGHRKHCYQHYIDINSFTAAPASKIADAGSYIFKDCNNSRIRGKYHEEEVKPVEEVEPASKIVILGRIYK